MRYEIFNRSPKGVSRDGRGRAGALVFPTGNIKAEKFTFSPLTFQVYVSGLECVT